MSMDPSMIAGTGLLELVKPARKSKALSRRAAREAAQEIDEGERGAQAPATPAPPKREVSAHSKAYLRFLALATQTATKTRLKNEEEALDANEKALLELVMLRWAVGAPMTVRQAIALAHLGSPATLHKRLMRLRKKKFLDLEHVSGDRRVKRLIAGELGHDYMDTMGRHMATARQALQKGSPSK